MATVDLSDGINALDKDEKCKSCGKLVYSSQVSFHPPENNLYCSCLSKFSNSDKKCAECGQKLDNTLYQIPTKVPSYTEDNSSPELCENCKRTTWMKIQKSIVNNSNGSSWVTCPYCSVKLLARNLEKHQQTCLNSPTGTIFKHIETQNQTIKRLETKIHELELRDKEREDKINTLEEQVAQLSKTYDLYNKAAQLYSKQLKTTGRVEISEMKNLEFMPNDSSFSGRTLENTFRNNNNSNEMSFTQAKRVNDFQTDNRSRAETNASLPQNNQRPGRFQQTTDQYSPPSGPQCMNGSININAPHATFHMGSENFRINVQESAQLGCGRGQNPNDLWNSYYRDPFQSNMSMGFGRGRGDDTRRSNRVADNNTSHFVEGGHEPNLQTNPNMGNPQEMSRRIHNPDDPFQSNLSIGFGRGRGDDTRRSNRVADNNTSHFVERGHEPNLQTNPNIGNPQEMSRRIHNPDETI